MARSSNLNRHPRRRGTVVILAAVCLTVIIGVVALATDGAILLSNKRYAQATADAAALAGASLIVTNQSDGVDSNGKVRQAIQKAVDANSSRSGMSLSQVTIRIAPQQPLQPSPTITDDTGQLRKGYMEVIVTYTQQRYFSGIFGGGDLTVQARAVARGGYKPYRDGIIVLDQDESRALHIHGVGGAMNLTVGGGDDVDIIVNSSVSTSPGAASADGGATVSGISMTVSGVEETSGGGSWVLPDGVVRNAVPTADPLRNLPPPDPTLLGLSNVPGSGHYVVNPGNPTLTLNPGVYPRGITITGNTTDWYNVTMNPGIYYIEDGGFTITGQVNVIANGVMIYNASPPGVSGGNSNGISISGGGSFQMTALNSSDPNAAIYNGISMFVNRDSGTPISITGGASTNFTGTVYAPSSPVTVTGNGDATIGSRYISRTLDIGGTGNLLINYDPTQPPHDRILQLVE